MSSAANIGSAALTPTDVKGGLLLLSESYVEHETIQQLPKIDPKIDNAQLYSTPYSQLTKLSRVYWELCRRGDKKFADEDELISALCKPHLTRSQAISQRQFPYWEQARLCEAQGGAPQLTAQQYRQNVNALTDSRELYNQGRMFSNVTFFPCTMYIPKLQQSSTYQVAVVLFGVLYSSFPAVAGTHLLPECTPKYVNYTTDEGVNMYVDMQFITGIHSQAAIVAALNSTHPHPNSFITFIPMVKSGFFNDWGREIGWTVSGSSLGLAVSECILGSAPVAYTGYI